MAKNNVTSAGIGRAIFSTRLQLTLQAAKMCIEWGLIPGFLIPMCIWFSNTSGHDIDIVKAHFIAAIADQNKHSEWLIRDEKGVLKRVWAFSSASKEPSQDLLPREALASLDATEYAWPHFKFTLYLSIFLGLLGYFGVWFLLDQLGERSQDNKRIRGGQYLVPERDLDRLVRVDSRKIKHGFKGFGLKFADVTLPPLAPTMGTLVQGAAGSGKSLAIHDLMQQVFKAGRKCVIYDQSGEFFKAYFRPGKDVFFNPGLVGSAPWSLFDEVAYDYDANKLALGFLPKKENASGNTFFEDAARALFTTLLRRLKRLGSTDTADLPKALLHLTPDELDELIKQSIASASVGQDAKGQRQGVIASMSVYLDGMSLVQSGRWTVKDFINSEDDSRLFILNDSSTKDMFLPMFRLMLQLAFSAIEAKQEVVHEDRFWFFLDEVHTLGDIKLDEAVATLRKYGVAIVSGVQSRSQFDSLLGDKRAATVLSCFSTNLILRMTEPDMQKKAAEFIGKMEVESTNQNQALAVNEMRDGAGITKMDSEKWVVMPSELGDLGVGKGFLKLTGGYPTAKIDYSSWLKDKAKMASFSPKVELPEKDERFLALLDSRVGASSGAGAGGKTPWELIAQDALATKNAKLQQANTEMSQVAPLTKLVVPEPGDLPPPMSHDIQDAIVRANQAELFETVQSKESS